MINKIIFTLAGIYCVIYTISYIVYEHRAEKKLSVVGNALLTATAVIVYVMAVRA